MTYFDWCILKEGEKAEKRRQNGIGPGPAILPHWQPERPTAPPEVAVSPTPHAQTLPGGCLLYRLPTSGARLRLVAERTRDGD